MAIPDTTLTIREFSLGITAGSSARAHVKVGNSSQGTVNYLYSFSDIADVQATLGYGPLVESIAYALAVAGGPVYAMRVNATAGGTAGAVTKSNTAGATPGTATMTVTGTPYDAYDVRVDIVRGGDTLVAGTAVFRYSLDGGLTWSADLAVPTGGTYAVTGTNLSFVWAYVSGTAFVAGDRWTFRTTAPGFSTGELSTTFDAFTATSVEAAFAHVVGPATGTAGTAGGSASANSAAVAAIVDTKLGTAANAFRFMFGVVEAPAFDSTYTAIPDADLETAFSAFSSPRVMVAAGYANITSPITSRQISRSAAWPITARLAQVQPSESPAFVDRGPLRYVTALGRDERATQRLDAARFATLRTIIGRTGGFYVTNGRIMAAPGSDFTYVMNRRVMDIAAKSVRDAVVGKFLNKAITVDSTTGMVAEFEARNIESYTEALLRAAIVEPGDASSVQVAVDRTNNILSTSTLKVRARVIPKGYAMFIDIDLGFLNPALAAAA